MTSSLPVQAMVVFVIAILGWQLVSDHGRFLFLLCLAAAVWRLWRMDARHRGLHGRFYRPDAPTSAAKPSTPCSS